MNNFTDIVVGEVPILGVEEESEKDLENEISELGFFI